MSYDAAGKLTNDTYTGAGTRNFDAENRMTSAGIAGAPPAAYAYDGDGRRIKRIVNGTETWQVYGIGGELLAEYAANESASNPQKEYGYRNGELLITADAPSAGSEGGAQNVNWTNAVGVSVSGNSLTKTATEGWGNSGAASNQTIASDDGYAEFSSSGITLFGLSHVDADQNYASIEFGWHINTGNLYVFESGVNRGQFGTVTSSDRLRLSVEGGVVKYRKNGTVLYTSTVAPTYPLLVDTALYTNGSSISNVVMTVGGPQNVSWTNAAGVTPSGNNLTKTAAEGWGNSGAASTQTIPSDDGYAEFSASQLTLFGLSRVDTDQNYTSIEFGLHIAHDGSLYVFESGVNRGLFGTVTFADRLRVSVEGGVVKYRKNGTLLYTSTVAPSYPLLVDTALYSNNSTINNVVISGNLGGGGGASTQIRWLVADHLGTPRMVFDQTGSLANISRHDYLPFGEELFAGTGGRTTAQGYSQADGVRQHFTGQERDTETGLDNFKARYFSSTQGRFTSVDPSRKSIIPTNPQTWNRYSYTYNNPLVMVDNNGKWPTGTHKDIIEKAFRTLDPKLVRHIQRGSEMVDRLGASPRTLYEKNAPQHAMTPGYKVRELGSVEKAREWARNEATNFINSNMAQAKDYYEKSNQADREVTKQLFTVGAFEAFGKGAHPIMDGPAPGHHDFQVYDTQGYKLLGALSPLLGAGVFGVDMLVHSNAEGRKPTDAEMNQMVDDLRMQLLNAFGREAYERAVPEADRKETDERKRKQRQ
jgi:RHS repeat-associated protein